LTISTKQQEVFGTSLQQQEEKAIKYASDNNLHIAKFFTTAESAYKTGRKIFNFMLDIAAETGVKDIVFMCTDRMSRNFQDWSRLKSLIEEKNFTIHFYQEGTIIHKNSHHTEKFVMNIKLAVAEGHSDKVSHDSKQTTLWKVKHGIAPGGTPPPGYSYDKMQKKYIKDKNAELIMRIFDLYDNKNYTALGVCDWLNIHGHKTQRGNKWNRTTVLRLLSNIFYTGKFEYQGNIYQGTHEPYISEDIYGDRLEKMKLRYKSSKVRKNEFHLKGLVFNGETGNMLTGEMKKERFVYYSQRRPFYFSYKEEELFDLIDDKMKLIYFSSDFENYLKDLFNESVEINENGQAKEQELIKKEIIRLEKEQNKLLQLLIDGIDERTIWIRMEENKKFITRLENQHQQIRINKTDFILEVSFVIERVKNIFKVYENADFAEKGSILKTLAKKIHVLDNHVTIEWNPPYSFIFDERVLKIANSLPVTAASSDSLHNG